MEVGAEIKLVSQVPLYALEECLTLCAFINQHLRARAVLTIARVQLKLRSLCGCGQCGYHGSERVRVWVGESDGIITRPLMYGYCVTHKVHETQTNTFRALVKESKGTTEDSVCGCGLVGVVSNLRLTFHGRRRYREGYQRRHVVSPSVSVE